MTLQEILTERFRQILEPVIDQLVQEALQYAPGEGWHEARGSRPPGLGDTDMFEFMRAGRSLGRFAAGEFNWDLWCHYRPAPNKR